MRKDNRNRHDRVLRRNVAFQQLLPGMVDAYLQWSTLMGESCTSEYRDEGKDVNNKRCESETYNITVIDIFRMHSVAIL